MDVCFPRLCGTCGAPLLPAETCLCTSCTAHLPLTYFWQVEDNRAAQCFWGRVPFQHTVSFLFFKDDSAYRTLLHAFKYNHNRQIGFELGRLFGRYLLQAYAAESPFVMVPVPLRPSKRRRRGFNQSEVVAEGIAQVTGWKVEPRLLQRVGKARSQTTKDRTQRWVNVQHVFAVRRRHAAYEALREAGNAVSLLLVDDVITTGATLEACAHAVLDALPEARISAASLFYVD